MGYLTYSSSNYPTRELKNPYGIRSPDALGDPFLANTVLFLKDSFVDTTQGLSPVASNGVTLNTNTKKYGTTGLDFAGTTSYATYSSNNFAFGTNPYTIEFWVNVSGSLSNAAFWSVGATQTTQANILDLNVYGNGLRRYDINYGYTFTSRLNLWTHVATVRSSGRNKLYINGVLSGDIADTINVTQTFLHIGAYINFANYGIKAVFDSFRVTKGIARYTSNFDPELDTFLN